MELEGEQSGKNVRHVILACDAVIDNQTGAGADGPVELLFRVRRAARAACP